MSNLKTKNENLNQDFRGNGHDVILQAFHWNLVKTQKTGTIDNHHLTWYQILLSNVEQIAEIGFTIIYLPPPWRDDSSWENANKHGGGEGYFWRDFDLNSRYGTKEQLTDLISKCHQYGIKAIIDLVTNHRDGARMEKDIWPHPGPHWSTGGTDSGGRFMDGKYDLNLLNSEVSERMVEAMNELMNDCGVDGWRWDYVWGYAVEDVNRWIEKTKMQEYFSVGEYWQSSPYLTDDPMIKKYGPDEATRILGWAEDSRGLAFDICLKREINSGVAKNLTKGINLSPDPLHRSSVVTFVDNHDMGASPYSSANSYGQQCWPCPPEFKSRAYAFILTTPGTPCVYWPDCFDWGHMDEIRKLLWARKKANIVAFSSWKNLSEHSGFCGIFHNKQGDDALILAIDSNYAGPSSEWECVINQNCYRVWLKK